MSKKLGKTPGSWLTYEISGINSKILHFSGSRGHYNFFWNTTAIFKIVNGFEILMFPHANLSMFYSEV